MISFKDFAKQKAEAEKLLTKFNQNKFSEADRANWLKLDLEVRKIVLKNDHTASPSA